jgi:hypothetical protein
MSPTLMPMRNSIRLSAGTSTFALEHAALNFNGAAHSVDDADEFHQHAISGRLNDMAAVLGDFGINQILTMRL